MSNHWHFIVRPRSDGDVTAFFRWLTHTHTQRWHSHHGTSGTGHVYQGRFKCFPVQRDEHLAQVLRYVQLNPVRAKAAKRAAAWRWGSCHVRRHGPAEMADLLTDWPIAMPSDWDAWLDEGSVDDATAERIAHSIARGTPFGSDAWVQRTAAKLNLGSTLRPRGRPRKAVKAERPATADTQRSTGRPR
jgi:putative transposase